MHLCFQQAFVEFMQVWFTMNKINLQGKFTNAAQPHLMSQLHFFLFFQLHRIFQEEIIMFKENQNPDFTQSLLFCGCISSHHLFKRSLTYTVIFQMVFGLKFVCSFTATVGEQLMQAWHRMVEENVLYFYLFLQQPDWHLTLYLIWKKTVKNIYSRDIKKRNRKIKTDTPWKKDTNHLDLSAKPSHATLNKCIPEVVYGVTASCRCISCTVTYIVGKN